MSRFAMSLVVGALIASAAGCASVKESHSADGRKAYTLNCSGLARGWDKCLAAAGEICGTRGYDVLDRVSERTASIGGSPGSFFGAQSAERSMVVACRG